jgi:hypothetical protein
MASMDVRVIFSVPSMTAWMAVSEFTFQTADRIQVRPPSMTSGSLTSGRGGRPERAASGGWTQVHREDDGALG